MAKSEKKLIRERFRNTCLKRDGYKCKMCEIKTVEYPDVHHITDRTLMINGGYVRENGISLCPTCHLLAEQFHTTGTAVQGYSPQDLYLKIGSGYEKAVKASEKL